MSFLIIKVSYDSGEAEVKKGKAFLEIEEAGNDLLLADLLKDIKYDVGALYDEAHDKCFGGGEK